MNRKPKILMVNEASFLATGYSTYGMEVLKRLHASGKYELAELACYITQNDPRSTQVPWRLFANHPESNRHDEFNRKPTNQFGEFSFEKVCLKFKPDIVFDIRDWWMMEFEERSPFRSYFKWVIMPTVDASPQQEQWLATFMNADGVFTYSDWGHKVLDKEGGGLIKTLGSAPPGADTVTFTPMDKLQLRRKFHFEDDVQIIGTVMRNQGRKLYPELIQAFADFQKKAPPEMAKKTFLYLHTSYPDLGWDIPRLIKMFGVSHRTLVTYKCQRCNAVFPSFFMDAKGPCVDCGFPTASMPNIQEGVERSTLARIINLFDVYVQYANSEGFGMPQVEAASCGVPVFATDYSAMGDIVRKVNGYPINVQHYRMDTDFGCYRAIPNNQDLIDKWITYFSLPNWRKKELSKKARQGVESHYSWDKTAEKWERVFDDLMKSPPSSWYSPLRTFTPKPVPRIFETNEELVRWCIENVLGRPDMVNSYLALRLIRDLNWGMSMRDIAGGGYANESSLLASRGRMKNFTNEDMIQELTYMCENINKWELERFNACGQ